MFRIVSSLIIPLSLAHAHQDSNHGFAAYLEEFYLTIPGKFTYQSIYRQKPWLKEYAKYWPSFNLGQAFIELEQNYCDALKCTICPLGRTKIELV